MRRLLVTLGLATAMAVGAAGSAAARPPDDKPPPDRGGRVPACQLGLNLLGEQICLPEGP